MAQEACKLCCTLQQGGGGSACRCTEVVLGGCTHALLRRATGGRHVSACVSAAQVLLGEMKRYHQQYMLDT